MRYFRVVPFNIDHAQKAGEFCRIVLEKRDELPADGSKRAVIPNDTKLFAQAETIPKVSHFLTADKKCESIFELIKQTTPVNFEILSLHSPCYQSFGHLQLDDGLE